jgi:hypothetical protein
MAEEDHTGVAEVLASRPSCFSLTSNAGPYYRSLHETPGTPDHYFNYMVKNQHPLDKFFYFTEVKEVVVLSTKLIHSWIQVRLTNRTIS